MENKLIKQPDILSLDTLGSFMDAQNDPIAPAAEEKLVTNTENYASDAESEEVVQNVVQDESSEVVQVDTIPQKPKVTRARRGRQSAQPVIEAGSGEWDMMVRSHPKSPKILHEPFKFLGGFTFLIIPGLLIRLREPTES